VQLALPQIREAGGDVVVVGKDAPADLARLAGDEGFQFTMLSDPGLVLVDAFGLRHRGADVAHGGDISRPAALFFDARGRLRDRFLTDDWRVRLTADEALRRMRALLN
jgi:peroxiredoxin